MAESISEALLDAVVVLRSLARAYEAGDPSVGWQDAAVAWPWLGEDEVTEGEMAAMGMAKAALAIMMAGQVATGVPASRMLDAIVKAEIQADEEGA